MQLEIIGLRHCPHKQFMQRLSMPNHISSLSLFALCPRLPQTVRHMIGTAHMLIMALAVTEYYGVDFSEYSGRKP